MRGYDVLATPVTSKEESEALATLDTGHESPSQSKVWSAIPALQLAISAANKIASSSPI